MFHRALHPAYRTEIDAELVREMTARPDRRGLSIERKPNALGFKILGGANAGARVDENVAVAKYPGRKNRQRHEWTIARPGETDEFRRRQFGDVEFLSAHHAIEHVATGLERQASEIDALDRDIAFADRFQPIVAAGGEGQVEAGHV